MSSDYRPRGGSSEGGSGRRRRGGRGRGRGTTGQQSGEHRSQSNGRTNGTHGAPKKQNPIAAFFSWITGGNKKKGDHSRPLRSMVPAEGVDRPHSDRLQRTDRPERTERSERQDRGERTDRGPRPERSERPPRAERPEPTPQEVTTPKLYVGNLAYEASESDLFDLFSKVGAVKNVEVAMDRRSNRSKGFAFVEMETLETAKDAAEKLNRTDFLGRQIVVSGAKMERRSVNGPRDEQPSEGTDAGSESSTSASSSEESNI